MSDVPDHSRSPGQRSKANRKGDGRLPKVSSKASPVEGVSGYKDKDKDSAYFEDAEGIASPVSESLPKKILNIIDPDRRQSESYCYTFIASGSDDNKLVQADKTAIIQPSGSSSDQSHVLNPEEGFILNPEDKCIDTQDSSPQEQYADQHQDDKYVNWIKDADGSISSGSLVQPTDPEPAVTKRELVCIVEVHRAQDEEASDVYDVIQDQYKQIAPESESVRDTKPSVSHGTDTGRSSTDESCTLTLKEFESKLKTGPPPQCDWLLPELVSPRYAGVCERHESDSENRDNEERPESDAIQRLVAKWLCFLSDAEHIDDWLKFSLQRQCVDVQKIDQSDVVQLTACRDAVKSQRRWPWYHNNQLLIHLRPIDDQLLQTGDTYLCVQTRDKGHRTDSDRSVEDTVAVTTVQDTPVVLDQAGCDHRCLCLMLYTKEADKQSSYVLWECHYSQLFNMDFIHNVTMTNPDDLAEILNHCLIAVETCTRRLALKRPPTPCRSCRERKRDLLCYHSGSAGDGESDDNANNNYHGPIVQPRILPAYDRCKEKPATSHSGAMFCDQIDSHHSSSSLTDSRNKLADSLSTPGITSPSDDSERQQSQRKEARAVYKRAPDGSLVKADVTPCTQTISLPLTIRDLHVEALMSGAVIYPGCRDVRGAALVIVFCKHPAWRMEYFTSQELAKILLYYYTVPRKDVAHKGLTVIADARGTTPPVLNAFLETLYTVQASQPGAIYISHVLADKVAQSLLFRSPVFRPQVNLKIDLVMSVETLYKFVSPEHLPPELGGYLHNDHVSWVQFRLKLESFLKQCRDVGEQLVHLMREMSALECLPATAPDASHQVELHKQCASQALEGDTLLLLREQGCSVLSSLSTHQHDLADNEDFRSSLHAAEHLYNQVQDTATKLSQLAKDHLHRLETCNQRHLLETQMSELLSWLETEGDRILEKHRVVADNLKAIRKQQKEFENAYFSAMTQLEKGSDLLEEANLLSQSDAASDVTCGVSDLSAELKERMSEYTGRLEDVRERIEDTSRCYHMLDKSYEWALNAMKYAASLKLDRLTSTENVDDLIHGLDVYTKDNPPLGADTFDLMLELSKRLDNDKLYDQCKTARARCKETEQLLRERAAKLRQAKERLARADGGRRMIRIGAGKEPSDDSAGASPGKTAGPTTPTSPTSPATTTTAADCSALSRSFDSSPGDFQSSPGPFANKDLYVSHLMNALRRRSYAGKPSAPLYNPGVAAFKESVREMNLWEYEEYLFNEGLITEDMSDRIVAFLPKGLSDLTMRGSRESLRESVDNLAQLSADGASPDRKSDSLPRDLGASVKDSSKAAGTTLCTPPSLGTTLNKHNKPHRKMLKKATSCSLPDSNVTETLPSIREQRDIRSVSMITASTESLPCMPEEDTVPSGTSSSQPQSADTSVTSLSHKECDPSATPPITTERKFGWSPVPVNTHLMYRQSQPVTLTASQSMADLRVTENQVKRRRILSLILHEMIQTERDYVKSLQFIIENYIPEISRQDVPQTLRGKRSIIFGNIEKIYEFHSLSFLAELEKCQTNPYSVCHAFLKHDQEFFLYALYNKNKPKSDALMAEYGMAFFKKKQVELGDRMDLNSYLLKPVQRMGKYALLLKQIIKECAETDPEYNDLCAAMEMVKFQLRHGNDLLAMDCLKDCDVNLQEQGMLLRQDEFLVWQGRKKSLRHVFLFEEMVLFSKTKRTSSGQDLYIYKNSLKTSDLGLTESVADSKHKFEIWFRKRTAGGTFTLQAPTMDVKNAWVKEISMLLWKQAFRNRERRLSEAARMGIGRKPCMDLKPSQHNIQDRFVNIAISNSGSSIPRMRNSIAVSSFEHLRNGGKRPHSLVSVSSSSSAGSNQSSNSGCVTVQPNSGSLDVVHEDQRVPDVARQYPYPTETNMDMVDLTTNLLSPSSSMEDACTQTTLRRPLKHKDGPCDESCV